ncbi:MAG TPA: glycosyltransferase family 2 protein [Wenzhouxiangellaceae bacterium]|nr:glycosyltransferase family 2 protein [Wenzhouxiangellaceae bacterium]
MNGAADARAGSVTDRLARVDVLVVNYNAGGWLARALANIRPEHAGEPNLIVVDNGSTDDSLKPIQRPAETGAAVTGSSHPITIDRAGRNTGFAAGVNRAAEHATREFLLILNPDCLIDPAAVARLIDELDHHPEAALVSGKVRDCHGKEQRGSRRRLPTPSRIVNELLPLGGPGIDTTNTPAPENAIEIEAVSGACMLMRRNAFVAVGGMDEGYPLHFEDLDLFARLAEAGQTLRWVPEVEVVHAGGQSSSHRPVAVLWAKHRGLWRYLNRHCSQEWPRWQRPFWWLALILNAAIRTPLVWAAARFRIAP